EREMSIQICDQLMLNCNELVPATVLFYAPPYYPAINSTENDLVQEKIKLAQEKLNKQFGILANPVNYFNGISDSSYVNYNPNDSGWHSYKYNTPVWGNVYSIPFEEMQRLQAPVINVGPLGKDAHKLSERLHMRSAFEYTPYVLQEIILSLFSAKV